MYYSLFLTPRQIFRFRIDAEDSLFVYKGDKELEQDLTKVCDVGGICDCGSQNARCGADAFESCFPSESQNIRHDGQGSYFFMIWLI